MEGLESFAGVQHSQDEPQKRLRQLAGGKTALEMFIKGSKGRAQTSDQYSTFTPAELIEPNEMLTCLPM